MKRSKIMVVVAVLAASNLIAAKPAVVKPSQTGPEQFGGIVMKPAKGVVRYFDYQKKISKADLMGFFLVSSCPIRLNFDHKVMSGEFAIPKATDVMGDANIAIFIVDDPALPMTLVAVENKWGLVNVAELTKDNPSTLKLLRRADKLVTRVGTQLLGGSYNLQVPFSAMQPVFSIEDLDKMSGRAIAPPSLTQILYSIKKLGLTQSQPATYEQACVEGWAPAPTNDIQREIWKDVKNPANRFMKDLPELKK